MLNLSIKNLISTEQKEQILKLRYEAYIEDFGDSFDKNGINWNSVDDSSTHLGLFKNDTLVSCLRITISDDLNDFAKILLIDPPDHLKGLFAFFARAATLKNSRSQHSHSRLRAAALKYCINKNVQSIWGTLPTSALRIPQLKDLNYNIQSFNLVKSNYLQMKNALIVSLIGQSKIQETYNKLNERLKLTDLEFFNEPQSN